MEKFRNTKQKQLILDALKSARRPLSINEVHSSIPDIAKSTIYRNIDALLKQGLIDKYYLNDNELFYMYKSDSSEHKHYIICDECNKMFDLPVCPIHNIESYLEQEGFSVSSHYIQILGKCKHCIAKTKKVD